MKPSTVYFVASNAAFESLPEASKLLIRTHDALAAAWSESGWSSPMPTALKEANEAVHRDPLANASMSIRVLGNEAHLAESNIPKAALLLNDELSDLFESRKPKISDL